VVRHMQGFRIDVKEMVSTLSVPYAECKSSLSCDRLVVLDGVNTRLFTHTAVRGVGSSLK